MGVTAGMLDREGPAVWLALRSVPGACGILKYQVQTLGQAFLTLPFQVCLFLVRFAFAVWELNSFSAVLTAAPLPVVFPPLPCHTEALPPLPDLVPCHLFGGIWPSGQG